MKDVALRYQRVSDAKRFYEILCNPKFKFFGPNPKSLKEEVDYLKKTKQKRKDNYSHEFTILYKNKIVGGTGIKIDQHRKFIGEIGYFIDETYWRKGIATKAVKILEKIGFEKLKLKRIEIVMNPKNKASVRVAVKNKYKREGLMKKKVVGRDGYQDCYMYAKVK
jgi:ribosomal-protein-alanine N-acetyltransferase